MLTVYTKDEAAAQFPKQFSSDEDFKFLVVGTRKEVRAAVRVKITKQVSIFDSTTNTFGRILSDTTSVLEDDDAIEEAGDVFGNDPKDYRILIY